MDLGNPLADVVPGPRGLVLATLVQLEAPVTGRALAKHAGVSPQTALIVVNDLLDAGLLTSERAGTARLVALNRQHLLAEPLVAMGRTRGRLVVKLQDELSDWTALAGAWLFGSAARGEGGPLSDVDVLLIAETSTESEEWAEWTAQLVDHVLLWTGNQAQLVEHSRDSFSRLIRDGNALVTAIRAEGIPLTPDTRRLLRRPS